MSKVEQIESKIKELSSEELAAFRQWFAEFDSVEGTRQARRSCAAGPHRWKVYQAVNRSLPEEIRKEEGTRDLRTTSASPLVLNCTGGNRGRRKTRCRIYIYCKESA
jgi:hypothetical protein